jgi:BirA family biotin operon repressor/biotin-[acetyl-CoA-carboxylase] ligase
VADSLAPEAVTPLLLGHFGRPYRHVERCASTQKLLGPEDTEGTVAVAEQQTEGRGRLGRSWHAPAGTSILVSVLLRPQVEAARLPELSPVAGRAVADAINAETGVETRMKHPNDVLIGDRKVAGILAEAIEGRVVLGIGVNVNQTRGELPEGVDPPATSLLLETGSVVERAPLLAAILRQLERTYDDWVETTGSAGSG